MRVWIAAALVCAFAVANVAAQGEFWRQQPLPPHPNYSIVNVDGFDVYVTPGCENGGCTCDGPDGISDTADDIVCGVNAHCHNNGGINGVFTPAGFYCQCDDPLGHLGSPNFGYWLPNQATIFITEHDPSIGNECGCALGTVYDPTAKKLTGTFESGPGDICNPVDECEETPDICGPGGICKDLDPEWPGRFLDPHPPTLYQCSCNSGLAFNLDSGLCECTNPNLYPNPTRTACVTDPCAGGVCASKANSVCVRDASLAAGYSCECNDAAHFVEVDGVCQCDVNRVQSGSTCVCATGYAEDAATGECYELLCPSTSCPANTECVQSGPGADNVSCECSAPFIFDGVDCRCPDDYAQTGAAQCTLIDYCPSIVCLSANQVCEQVGAGVGNAMCQCPSPFTAISDVECECAEHSEYNGTSNTCDPINYCADAPEDLCNFVEHAICVNDYTHEQAPFYHCECAPSFVGDQIKYPTVCSCPENFELNTAGDACIPIDPCFDVVCGGDAVCVGDLSGDVPTYECVCPPTYQYDADAMDCVCAEHYEDVDGACSPIDYCAGYQCRIGSECRVVDFEPVCECHAGIFPRLSDCVCGGETKLNEITGACDDVNECEETPDICSSVNQGMCINLLNGYTCACIGDFQRDDNDVCVCPEPKVLSADGSRCEIWNACTDVLCGPNAECHLDDSEGNDFGFYCECDDQRSLIWKPRERVDGSTRWYGNDEPENQCICPEGSDDENPWSFGHCKDIDECEIIEQLEAEGEANDNEDGHHDTDARHDAPYCPPNSRCRNRDPGYECQCNWSFEKTTYGSCECPEGRILNEDATWCIQDPNYNAYGAEAADAATASSIAAVSGAGFVVLAAAGAAAVVVRRRKEHRAGDSDSDAKDSDAKELL